MATLNTRLTLIQKISQTQDENSWEEFVHYYKRYLYVVVRNMNISHHDTEELIQTVMLKVWDKLKDFQYHPSKGKFRYWLCTIARNSVVDFIRRSQSQQRRRDGLKQEKEVDNLNNIELPAVEEIAEREWQNYIANLALESTKKQFNEKHVNCFLLYSEGKTIAEVAEALSLSENSVYIYKAKVQESIVREMKRLDHEIG
ncbi:MAG: sigma-70 family RNA polymerase sigma factor [Lentisphaeraceae bacterium]|nr:sigma-70 family RNA polymerase sigma factor [Lentisphaeraceae bacterium]